MDVAIADDSALFRDGLAGLLTAAGITVSVVAASGLELEARLRGRQVDAVVLDVRMPPHHGDDGIVTAMRLRAERPELAVVVLSTYAQPADAFRLLDAGGAGVAYLLKDRVDDLESLRTTLDRVTRGETVLDAEIVSGLLARQRPGPFATLTPRERSVLELMARGRSNAGIGTELFLSSKTVEAHAAMVFAKLGLAPSSPDNRRVLAVLAYLRAQDD